MCRVVDACSSTSTAYSAPESDVIVESRLSVVVDCSDPRALADFWRLLVGGVLDEASATSDWVALREFPELDYLGFQRVPEMKLTKNRVHLDVIVDDLGIAIARGKALGARALGNVVDEALYQFQVMSDPEGNEFCFVFRKPNN